MRCAGIIDPMASLQYMGGALPIHFAMLMYCTVETTYQSDDLNFMKLNWREKNRLLKYQYDDV